MAPFYGWGSTASRLDPLLGGSLSFQAVYQFIITTKWIPGTTPKNNGEISKDKYEEEV